MNELIAINQSSIGAEEVNTVNARDLHSFLESKQQFADWIKAKVIDNPFFMENQDYVLLHNSTKQTTRGGHNRKDYALTIDTSKKVAMAEQTQKGDAVREYFIECEKVAKQAAPPQFQIPGNLPEALRLAADLAEKNSKLSEKISIDRPKVEFATAIEDSKKSIKIGDFAKILNNAGIKIGRNRLFEWLREKRYLMPNNEPYQNHIDSRWFSVIEKTRESDNGPVPYIQSMITGKGQIALTRKIIEHFNPIITVGKESRA